MANSSAARVEYSKPLWVLAMCYAWGSTLSVLVLVLFTRWFGGWYSAGGSSWWWSCINLLDDAFKVIVALFCGAFAPYTTMTVGYFAYHGGHYAWSWISIAILNDVLRAILSMVVLKD